MSKKISVLRFLIEIYFNEINICILEIQLTVFFI